MASFSIESLLSPDERSALWEARNEQKFVDLRKMIRRNQVNKIAEIIEVMEDNELNSNEDILASYALVINNPGLVREHALKQPRMQNMYAQDVLDATRLSVKRDEARRIMTEVCDAVNRNRFVRVSLNRFNVVELAKIEGELPTQDQLPDFINKGYIQTGYEMGIEQASQLILNQMEGIVPLAPWRVDIAQTMRGDVDIKSIYHDRKVLIVQAFDRTFPHNRIGGGFTLWLPTRIPKINVQLDYGFGETMPQTSVLVKPI